MVQKFLLESQLNYNPSLFVYNTLKNISLGILQQVKHDIWINNDLDFYCLCKEEIDADGERVYTAYQLYIKPDKRNNNLYNKITKFLRFYSQKQKYKRLYIISSRLDKIKAYQRGIGYSFKPKFLTFMEEY